MAEKVWIVLEGPDMTYYGDAEIHGVYTTEAAAVARAKEVWGEFHKTEWNPDYDYIGVGEYEVEHG